ncbi:hypothetical protein SLE2022_026070 [Rubroshorea leprosula]
MSNSPNRNPNPNRSPTSDQTTKVLRSPQTNNHRTRAISSPDVLYEEQALKHVIVRMQQHHPSLSSTPSPSPRSEPDFSPFSLDSPSPEYTSLLSDELLLGIFSKLPISHHVSNSLVCKRWLRLHGRLVQSLKLTDWSFLSSGRVFQRFPNLAEIDIIRSCIRMPRNSGIFVTRNSLSVYVDTDFTPNGLVEEKALLPSNLVDYGLKMIADKYPNLRRILVIGASEDGLSSIAEQCQTLQELELHCCGDLPLKGISGCRNLQVVKLIGCVDGFYNSVVSDIGLTLLAHGCRRLVKLELCGCEGSYDGIKAIGQCCQMLEELSICDHRMDGGWLAALSFCGNLKTLRLKSCKTIDKSPGLDEHLGSCFTLEELHLQRCQIRDKQSLKALFLVCENVREIILQDCWGLDDEAFGLASICRRVDLLSLEGCSLLTTKGLESVVLSWKELQRLRVVSCNNIKDVEVTSELGFLFSVLKELKWRPDTRSLLLSNLGDTGLGKKGDRFFKRSKG